MAQTSTKADPLKILAAGVLGAASAALPTIFGDQQNTPTTANLPATETRGAVAAQTAQTARTAWWQSSVVWLGAALLAVLIYAGTRR